MYSKAPGVDLAKAILRATGLDSARVTEMSLTFKAGEFPILDVKVFPDSGALEAEVVRYSLNPSLAEVVPPTSRERFECLLRECGKSHLLADPALRRDTSATDPVSPAPSHSQASAPEFPGGAS